MTLVENIVGEAKEMFGEVYLVGGAVRDMIMGKTPKDYDFSTPLSPNEIEQCVRNFGKKPYLVGKKFGTIGYKTHGLMAECTCFRKETYESGSRKPEVEFVSDLYEDLSRRDFTMNAIAWDGEKFIDPFRGQIDIFLEHIDSVGQPWERFREDPLRMLRAARFVSQFGFAVSDKVAQNLSNEAHTVLTVSRERWVQEVDKLLMGKNARAALRLMHDTSLLVFMFPGQQIQPGNITDEMTLDEKWAAILSPSHLLGENKITKAIAHEQAVGTAHRLKFSSARTKFILDSLKPV